VKTRIWVALLAVYIVWGSTYLAIRYMVEELPPFLSAGVRFLIAGLILLLWQRLRGSPAPTREEWKAATIIGLFLLLGGTGLLGWAEQIIPSGIASLFIGATPLWMALLDTFRPNGIRLGWLTWAGVLIGFLGIALLANPWSSSLDGLQLNLWGVLALLLAALNWSIGSLYSRKAPLPASPLMGTGMEMVAGSLGLLVLGTLLGEWSQLDLSAVTSRSLLSLLYLIVFGSLVGYVSYTWLLRNAPTPLVSTYAYVNPLVAILLGSFFGAEQITWRVIVCALIILSSVGLINFSRTHTASPVTPETISAAD
jgi:drug/metabolite transporter (DMT)-like permease